MDIESSKQISPPQFSRLTNTNTLSWYVDIMAFLNLNGPTLFTESQTAPTDFRCYPHDVTEFWATQSKRAAACILISISPDFKRELEWIVYSNAYQVMTLVNVLCDKTRVNSMASILIKLRSEYRDPAVSRDTNAGYSEAIYLEIATMMRSRAGHYTAALELAREQLSFVDNFLLLGTLYHFLLDQWVTNSQTMGEVKQELQVLHTNHLSSNWGAKATQDRIRSLPTLLSAFTALGLKIIKP